MAASKKKSLPLRHLTDTFTNQGEQMLKKSHLQERWQELKERELNAQQNNRQLLQQFDEAQDTLREMITLTADMTTIRMEYERYLEESYPRWQQQLERKTQSAQRQSMEEYLRSCLKNREERVSKSSADRTFNSKGPTSMSQQMAAPPNHYSQNLHMDYNQHGSPRLPYIQTSWQPPTQFQRARFPIRAQHQPQGYSHIPPSFPQHPDPYHHQHLDSPPGYHHSRQDAPGWAPLQPGPPWSLAAGAAGISACSEALWGPLYSEEPLPEIKVTEEEVDTSLAPSSKREGGSGGRSSHFSQELDIKPVRLYGGPAESSESSRESSQGSREKKKRGTSQKASLDSCSSHESSESSSAIVIAAATAATAAQHSESDASSEKIRSSTSRRKRRGGGLAVGSPSAEKPGEGSQGENSGSHREESRSTSAELGGLIEEARIEKGGNQRHGDNSESCGEESGSQREEESGHVSVKIENRGGDEIEKQESNSSEQSSVEGKEEEEPGSGDGEENGGGAEEKENSQIDEEQEERDADDDENVASEKNNTTDKEEETGSEEEAEDEEEEKGDPEEEKSEMLQIEDGENQKRVSTSSQDEDEDDSEGGEENTEDEESDEDEQRGDKAGEPEEERDSDDSIISPQQNRSKKMNVIPEENSEEEEEEEEGIKTGSSEDEISDDDVENLLAPQDQSEKEEKDLKAAEKPKAICDNVEIFQVEPDRSTKSDHPSDSDEFDQFYE